MNNSKMLNSKHQLTCSYCSRIFRDPIDLPCDDSICHEHLSERDVVKEKKIKCKECDEEFQVKDYDIKLNQTLANLIESHSYLSQEEIELKRELEDSIEKFYQFHDEFIQNRTKLESSVFDHFQEIRFQIDEHREELKKRIDEIALAMIAETKMYEEMYLKELKKSFSSFDDCKSLQNELNQIEETFRNPNLLIESIKEMQQKQEESLKDIQSKLTEYEEETSEVESFLAGSHEFQLDEIEVYQREENETEN